jgi:hypothetical protein
MAESPETLMRNESQIPLQRGISHRLSGLRITTVEKLLNKSGIFTDSIFTEVFKKYSHEIFTDSIFIELKDKMKGLMIFGIHLLDDIWHGDYRRRLLRMEALETSVVVNTTPNNEHTSAERFGQDQ